MISIQKYLTEAKIINAPHALLVIDVVNNCCLEKYETYNKFSKVRTMVPKLVKFIDWYNRETKGLVIYVNLVKWIKKYLAQNVSRLYDENPNVTYYADPKLPADALKFYKVKPRPGNIVITKNTYDAFAMPEMKRTLKKYNIQDLIITGVYSTGCVNATINGAFSNGFSMVILKDLVETFDDKENQQLQKSLIQRNWPYLYGPTMTSSEFITKFKTTTIDDIADKKRR